MGDWLGDALDETQAVRNCHHLDQAKGHALFPVRVFLTILAVVFFVETTVMFLLPHIFPLGTDTRWQALPDACLLTLISSPLLWWAIVRPLHRIAVMEQAKSESIVSASVEGILTINQSGRIESFNRAAEQILGYEAREIIGRDVTALVPDRLAERHRKGFRNYLETGRSKMLGRTVEYPGRHKDGREVPLAISVVAIRVDHRPLFTGIIRDLTEQYRIEAERQARARQQAAAVEFGRRALACESLSTLLNEAVQCVAQILNVEFIGVWEWLPGGKTLQLAAGLGWKEGTVGHAKWGVEQCERGIDQTFPCVFFQKRETKRHCHRCPFFLHEHGIASGKSVVILGSERPFGILVAYTTAERPFAEDEMHFLQDIATEITLALQRKRAELRQRQQDVARAEQMAMIAQIAMGVAHEIRNPLTSIKMLVQAVREEGDVDTVKLHEDLKIIEGEIRRMEQCIRTFLDFARPAKPERHCVDLGSLVERTIALTEARAARQRVTPRFTSPAEPFAVDADWGQMQQLLLNLTLNALDAMPQGGDLEVQLQLDAAGDVELCVLDTGPGIAPEILSQLFQPFVTSKEKGIGLGLVISQRIAEDHGGSLIAENRPGRGACFTLRLPVRDATAKVEV